MKSLVTHASVKQQMNAKSASIADSLLYKIQKNLINSLNLLYYCLKYFIYLKIQDPGYDSMIPSSILVNVADTTRFNKGLLNKCVLIKMIAFDKKIRYKIKVKSHVRLV